ncbi:MAG: hypothetical protein QXS48_01335 [Candidatus Aenigmatarchaeota archaeon]
MSRRRERIRLSSGVEWYLEENSTRRENCLAILARRTENCLFELTPATIWEELMKNSKYANVYNLSSRPIENEESVAYMLFDLPPEFSRQLLQRYRKKGYLERKDVEEVYNSVCKSQHKKVFFKNSEIV